VLKESLVLGGILTLPTSGGGHQPEQPSPDHQQAGEQPQVQSAHVLVYAGRDHVVGGVDLEGTYNGYGRRRRYCMLTGRTPRAAFRSRHR
jgi:hypothetical protein